jgi:hypothetical protein
MRTTDFNKQYRITPLPKVELVGTLTRSLPLPVLTSYMKKAHSVYAANDIVPMFSFYLYQIAILVEEWHLP